MRRSSLPRIASPVVLALALLSCTDSSEYVEPGPRPQIVAVTGPANAIVLCDEAKTGGACPLPVTVTFRLDPAHYVWKALVRFEGDGGDEGVDRGYPIAPTFGGGADVDATVTVNAAVPPSLVGSTTLLRYSVRLLTGAGESSPVSTLTVSVQ